MRARRLFLLSLIVVKSGSVAAESDLDSAGQNDAEEDGKDAHAPDDLERIPDEQLRSVHASIDANGDKKDSKEEFFTFVEKHDTEAAAAVIDMDATTELERLDTTKDGRVSLAEHLNDTLKGYQWAFQKKNDVDQKVVETAKETMELRRRDETEFFEAADANSDGFLEKEELKTFVSRTQGKALDLTVKHSFRDADADKNGILSLEEFVASGLGSRDPKELKEDDETNEDDSEREETTYSKQLFSRLDVNSDGHLDQGELQPLQSGRIHQEDVADNFVQVLDKNGDKSIDSDEFVQSKRTIKDRELQDYLIAWAKKRPLISNR